MTRPLVATKLYVPRLRRGLVARPRLVDRLGGDGRLTLVSAPAGLRQDDPAGLVARPRTRRPARSRGSRSTPSDDDPARSGPAW